MNIVTHNGYFHADDAFAIATLQIAGVAGTVTRTRDADKVASADMRIDVGRHNDPATGDFDHHQPGGAGKRANGIPYASFGLVWKHYGQQLTGHPDAAARVDRRLVQPIDADDTGVASFKPNFESVEPYTISKIIGLFNPSWANQPTLEDYDKPFTHAVAFAKDVLEREISDAKSYIKAVEQVREAIASASDPRIIELERRMPWEETVITEAPEALVVIFQSERGDWSVQTVKDQIGEFTNRRDLPEEWAGKIGDELAEVTGVADALFAHTARFLVTAKSKEGALELAKKGISDSKLVGAESG